MVKQNKTNPRRWFRNGMIAGFAFSFGAWLLVLAATPGASGFLIGVPWLLICAPLPILVSFLGGRYDAFGDPVHQFGIIIFNGLLLGGISYAVGHIVLHFKNRHAA